MKRKALFHTLLIVLFCLSILPSFAQVKGALTIQSDVIGARVYLNGEIAGYARPNFSILLRPGQYDLRVSMPGYSDYTARINMTSNPEIIEVNFRGAQSYALEINANVQGAEVYINNRRVGKTPYRSTLPGGRYSIRISAPGYEDASTSLDLRRNQNVTLNLLPPLIDVSIRIDRNSVIRSPRNTDAQLRISVDGERVSGLNFQVTPGTHTILVETGIFRIERRINFSRDDGNSQLLTLRLELD